MFAVSLIAVPLLVAATALVIAYASPNTPRPTRASSPGQVFHGLHGYQEDAGAGTVDGIAAGLLTPATSIVPLFAGVITIRKARYPRKARLS